ncbi:MAG: hypothetical protein ABW221_11840 [Vicinamibacteria bacterium]
MKKLVLSLAVAACLAVAHVGSAEILETFEDDCSVSVLIKKPYSNSIQFDQNDVLLARGWQGGNICALIDPNQGLQITGVCQTSQAQTTGWTQWHSYSSLKNSSGYFRWVCGNTLERSRCPAETKWVRFRLLGGDDEFRTQCSS